ncbi:Stk1 family PASTA domain-containing Ser/Thr kinase [Propionibacteriaceae bacterium Y2011]
MTDDTTPTSPGTGDSPQVRLIGDRYELSGLLGRGGMAEVRRAMDTRLNRPVAVKQLRTDLATDPTFQARFRREAQAAAGLNHPTIVSVYDTGEETDGQSGIRIPYIVMELVDGVTLRDVLRDGRKILPERALELSAGVLDALSYSHKAGIVHRDIKPANVMLTPAGDVKVMDFGIARAVADTSSTMTQTAAVIGTAQYLSPEQARGETVDARSDIYSAGCLLYELLVGRPPFVGESSVSVAYQHVREEPRPPSELDPEVTPGMDAVVMRSLAKDPNERYQSARLMKDDLMRLLHGQQPLAAAMPSSATTPGEAPTALLVPDHQPAGAAGAALAGGAVGAGAGAAAATSATRVTEPVQPYGDGNGGHGVVPVDEEPEQEPRRVGAIVALVVLIVLAAIAAGLAVYFLNTPPPTSPPPTPTPSSASPQVQMVEVPSVIGQTETQATNSLEGVGLEVKVEKVAGPSDSSVGQVTEQNPPAQQQVEVGTEVTITINVGPSQVTVPDVQGKSASEATEALKSAGFTNIKTEYATSEEPGSKKDSVVGVSPSEGSEQNPDTEITLTLATGEGEVPDFSGMTRERASQFAEEHGFKVEFEEEEVEGGQNTVIGQDPGPGNTQPWGSTIKVTIGVPEPSESPSPPGETEEPTETPTSTPTGGG